jgi:hypothetical protein
MELMAVLGGADRVNTTALGAGPLLGRCFLLGSFRQIGSGPLDGSKSTQLIRYITAKAPWLRMPKRSRKASYKRLCS